MLSGECRICVTLGLARADANGQDERLLAQFRRGESDEKAEIVRVLIRHGADVTARDQTHSTPLHQAVWAGHESLVRLLVERGARLDMKDVLWQGTPADWARYGGRSELETYLRAQLRTQQDDEQ